MKYDLEYIEKIAKIIDDNKLSEIILEDGDKAITVRKEIAYSAAVCDNAPMTVQTATPQKEATNEPVQTAQETTKPTAMAITSPMVGAFYAAPAPGAKPFVKVGDTVSVGQIVCIVEAMKLMNEIESEVSGKVTQILVEDGQSVEYGQVLMYVE